VIHQNRSLRLQLASHHWQQWTVLSLTNQAAASIHKYWPCIVGEVTKTTTHITLTKKTHRLNKSFCASCLVFFYTQYTGVCSSAVGWGTALQAGRSQVWFTMGSLRFFIDLMFQPHYGPGVNSASNRNVYQGFSVGGTGGRCVGLTTLPSSCADSENPGSLNLLESLGPI
jgi:hypothetical protein